MKKYEVEYSVVQSDQDEEILSYNNCPFFNVIGLPVHACSFGSEEHEIRIDAENKQIVSSLVFIFLKII